jgi:hypothetical protein
VIKPLCQTNQSFEVFIEKSASRGRLPSLRFPIPSELVTSPSFPLFVKLRAHQRPQLRFKASVP